MESLLCQFTAETLIVTVGDAIGSGSCEDGSAGQVLTLLTSVDCKANLRI